MDGHRCRSEKPPPRMVVQRSCVSAISPSMLASTEAATSLSTAPRTQTAPSRSNCAMTSSEINAYFIGVASINHLQRKYRHNCRTDIRRQGRLFEQQKTPNAGQFPGLLRHVRHAVPNGHYLRAMSEHFGQPVTEITARFGWLTFGILIGAIIALIIFDWIRLRNLLMMVYSVILTCLISLFFLNNIVLIGMGIGPRRCVLRHRSCRGSPGDFEDL